MRSFLRASSTALGVTIAAACAKPAPKPAPPREPPAHILVVALERVALRTTAWVELHAWLAAAAKSDATLDEAALDDAARRYARALDDDDDDAELLRTMRALSACADERCARSAVAGTAFERAYVSALPVFTSKRWLERAGLSRAGVEAARAAMGPEIEPLVTELSRDLALEWPSPPPVVDVVSLSPAAARYALVRPALGARSSCFVRLEKEPDRVQHARITDCLLFYAAWPLARQSRLYDAIAKNMKPRDAERAWTALLAHAVAVRVTTWESKHESPTRRSAVAVEGPLLSWLVEHWPARMSGEPVEAFGARYAEAYLARR
ncbi:MAG: hypothetical protein KF819_05610 [Labilithrix sp.]|nr:hypothetical protein [Labilithrix sp.]